MTREETIKVLAILKAAYPNSYKNMSKDEANGTVMVWAMQFSNIPVEAVMIAVNKLISTNPFPPAICDVKKKIESLYWEVIEGLDKHKKYKTLTNDQVGIYERILAASEHLRRGSTIEPSLRELTGGSQQYLIGNDVKG